MYFYHVLLIKKRKIQQKLRFSIMKEAKRLKKLKRTLIIQQKESSQIVNLMPTVSIKEEKTEMMDIEFIKETKHEDLNNMNTSLNLSTQQAATSSNEIVNRLSADNKNNKKLNHMNSKKIIKKAKKKNKAARSMTIAQRYEIEIQELSNSFLLQNILAEYLEIKSNYIGNIKIFFS